MRPIWTVVLWVAIAGVVGFFVSGPWLWSTAVGIDSSGYPAGNVLQGLVPGSTNAIAGLILGAGALVLVTVAAFFGGRAARRGALTAADPARRRFLTGAATGVGAAAGALVAGSTAIGVRLGLGVGHGGTGWGAVGKGIGDGVPMTHDSLPDAWKGSRVRAYRRLGRTGVEVSDISLGAGPISGDKGVAIVREALDRGVTYIDTAPDYSANDSEDAVGRAIKGRRDGLFLATKFCTDIGHLPPGTPVDTYKGVVEGSLTRLGTDHVDLVHIHSCDSVERLMDPNAHEAFDRLKEEGKVRFLGFSSHTPNLVEVANTAIDSGRFDVMMLAYHHGVWAPLGSIVERARREQDMGVVAMKTLKGAKHHGLAGFKNDANAYSQAAFRWVLSNDDVSCLVISFREHQHVDEYLHASGQAPSAADVALLRRYDQQIAGTYCSPHCGVCLDSCPEQVPIADVLRHRMYFEDYGREKEAMRLYSRLDQNASACASCAAPCMGSCPVGIPIAERTVGAHEMLTLA